MARARKKSSVKASAAVSQKRPMTVMQVIPNLGAGGAEQTAVDVTAGLVAAGHRAIVVSNGGPRVIDIERAGGIHIQMPVHTKNPLRMWFNAKRLVALVRKYKVDVIHARSRAPAWSCYWAWQKLPKSMRVHYLTTCHAPFNIGGEMKRKYNSSIAKGELVIANSEFVAYYMANEYGVAAEKIRVIPRGIPLEKFQPPLVNADRMHKMSQSWRIPEVATVVLLPGRLTRWKGQLVMIDAMAKLVEKTGRKDVYCVLVGDDQGRFEYRQELEDAIHEHRLEERVRIIGHCDDMATAYMLADVVVSASIEPEGFGRVAVEAQAMGRPVIATDIGGSKETVIPGQTGWLIPPADPEMLAQGIEFVLGLSEGEKQSLAVSAIDNVHRNFSKAQMVHSTLLVYEELLDRHE